MGLRRILIIDKSKIHAFISYLSFRQKQAILVALDAFIIAATFCIVLYATTPSQLEFFDLITSPTSLAMLAFLVIVGAVASYVLGLPRIKLKAYELQAVLRTGLASMIVGVAGMAYSAMSLDPVLNVLNTGFFTTLLIVLQVFVRISLRHVVLSVYLTAQHRKRILIYGAGHTGVQLAAALRTDSNLEPVAFIDDNPTLHRMVVSGLPVYSPVKLEDLIQRENIDRVILAMPSASRTKVARISRNLEAFHCDVRMVPSFANLINLGGSNLLDKVLPVDPTDYLQRHGLEHDLLSLVDLYGGQSVLISGAGGTIGTELARQLLICEPKRIVLLEISELALYQIERELRDLSIGLDVEIVPVLGSVTDEHGVRRAMKKYEIDVVLHAAAYKHVPMVELNRLTGLRNNVLGTRVMAEAARDLGVRHFVLVSTDKAVRPTNIMGASKRLAELVVQDFANRPANTRFSMVRFGNVLGSSGSVVPLFNEQIARGGPVTVTHPNVSRYFMTIHEAARLVLLAGEFSEGGDVFVLDMGDRVYIRDLAKQMIEHAGYTVKDAQNPDGDIAIEYTGLRKGEKMREELLISAETTATGHPKIMKAREDFLSEIEVATVIKTLRVAIEEGDEAKAMEMVRHWVEGYQSQVAPVEKALTYS